MSIGSNFCQYTSHSNTRVKLTISILVFEWLHTVYVSRRNRSLSDAARTINSFGINFYLRKQLTSLSKVKNVENSNTHSLPQIADIQH